MPQFVEKKTMISNPYSKLKIKQAGDIFHGMNTKEGRREIQSKFNKAHQVTDKQVRVIKNDNRKGLQMLCQHQRYALRNVKKERNDWCLSQMPTYQLKKKDFSNKPEIEYKKHLEKKKRYHEEAIEKYPLEKQCNFSLHLVPINNGLDLKVKSFSLQHTCAKPAMTGERFRNNAMTATHLAASCLSFSCTDPSSIDTKSIENKILADHHHSINLGKERGKGVPYHLG